MSLLAGGITKHIRIFMYICKRSTVRNFNKKQYGVCFSQAANLLKNTPDWKRRKETDFLQNYVQVPGTDTKDSARQWCVVTPVFFFLIPRIPSTRPHACGTHVVVGLLQKTSGNASNPNRKLFDLLWKRTTNNNHHDVPSHPLFLRTKGHIAKVLHIFLPPLHWHMQMTFLHLLCVHVLHCSWQKRKKDYNAGRRFKNEQFIIKDLIMLFSLNLTKTHRRHTHIWRSTALAESRAQVKRTFARKRVMHSGTRDRLTSLKCMIGPLLRARQIWTGG